MNVTIDEGLLHIDDEAAAALATPDADLGTIEVQMREVDHFSDGTKPYHGESVQEIGPIHERSKKAGVHSVR